MYKRLVEGIRKLRGRKNIDEAELKKERRYVYEKDAYAAFLHSISGIGVEDAYYLDFMIDLLRKEIKYSSLLEINRGGHMFRYLYPFQRMDPVLIRYKSSETCQIDLEKNNLISSPWNHGRYKSILKRLSTHAFQYDKQNHRADYYDYINVTCAYNGLHSLGVGSYLGKGTIEARYFDTTRIFPYVETNSDLSFTYNKARILQRMEKENISLDYSLERELQRRFYGTDYRLLLLYKLCQQKYFMDTGEGGGREWK